MLFGIFFGLVCILATKLNLLIGLGIFVFSIGLSWEVLGSSLGIETIVNLTGQKLAIIISMIGFIKGRIESANIFHVLALSSLFFLQSVFFGAGYDNFKAFIGFVAPLLLVFSICDERDYCRWLKILACLALLSLIISIPFHLLGIRHLFRYESLSGFRLQGMLVASHFAFLCLYGIWAGLILRTLQWKYATFILSLNFIFLVLTGTRSILGGALLITLLYLMPIKLDSFRFSVRKGSITILTVLSLPVLYGVYVVISRTMLELGIDDERVMSGRLMAWEYFMSRIPDSAFIGHGFGAAQFLNSSGELHRGFVVPHNEYIHYGYNIGLVGLVMLLSWFQRSFKASRSNCDVVNNRILFGGFAGYALVSFFDNTLSTPQAVWPLIILISCHRVLKIQGESSVR